MNKIIEKQEAEIESMIYEIRGVQVMLSSDVAKLYKVETKVLNQTIKRNINRFPDSFCFQLTYDEMEQLSSRSQIVTLNKSNNSFHDRFIILDRNKLYSCGASFKDLGKKCFAINEFDDKQYLNKLLVILSLNK